MNKKKEMKKIKYESYLTENTHLHVQDGNRKLGKGIYTINLLAGDKPLTKLDGTQLTNISGTCSGCCRGELKSAGGYQWRYYDKNDDNFPLKIDKYQRFKKENNMIENGQAVIFPAH